MSEIAGTNSPAVIAKYVETGDKDLAIRFLHSITTIIEKEEPESLKQRNTTPTWTADNIKSNENQIQQTSEMLIKIVGTTEQQQAVMSKSQRF